MPSRKAWTTFSLVVAVVAVGGVASLILILTAPRTARVEEPRPPKLVRTIKVEPRTEQITVTAYGVVIPSRELELRPEVQGRVVAHHEALVPGGYLPAGTELLRIDPADYELALQEATAALEEAEFELAVERGRQVVASREWRLLEKDLEQREANRSLVLRQPHLRRAEALVAKANNRIEKARLDMARTRIEAPFNALVLDERVEVGQLLERGTSVATLVGSDEFWVRVSLPIDQLRWIRVAAPGVPGASAEVILEDGSDTPVRRAGAVVRLLGDLETKGRMARILVGVSDPLGLESGEDTRPLLLGSYVRVDIDAGDLPDVLCIRRSALREGNRIWVVGKDSRLHIRPARVLWTRANEMPGTPEDEVLIAPDSLREGEELVVSGLRIALPEMEVTPQLEEASPLTGSTSGEKRERDD